MSDVCLGGVKLPDDGGPCRVCGAIPSQECRRSGLGREEWHQQREREKWAREAAEKITIAAEEYGPIVPVNCPSCEYREELESQVRRLRDALIAAEGFISGAVPHYAIDRNEAVNDVLPAIRAALTEETP